MAPISATLCCLVVNLVPSCGKNNPLNVYSHKILIFYIIGPHVSSVFNWVELFICIKQAKQAKLHVRWKQCMMQVHTVNTHTHKHIWKIVFSLISRQTIQLIGDEGRAYICDPTQVNEADVVRWLSCNFAVNVFYTNQALFWHKIHFDTIFHSKYMRKTKTDMLEFQEFKNSCLKQLKIKFRFVSDMVRQTT